MCLCRSATNNLQNLDAPEFSQSWPWFGWPSWFGSPRCMKDRRGWGRFLRGEPQSFAEVSRPFDRVLALSFHILWFELDLLAERVGAQPGKKGKKRKAISKPNPSPRFTIEFTTFGYILVHLGQNLTSFLRQCVVFEVSTPCSRPCLDSLGASVTMEGWPWRYPKWPSRTWQNGNGYFDATLDRKKGWCFWYAPNIWHNIDIL